MRKLNYNTVEKASITDALLEGHMVMYARLVKRICEFKYEYSKNRNSDDNIKQSVTRDFLDDLRTQFGIEDEYL